MKGDKVIDISEIVTYLFLLIISREIYRYLFTNILIQFWHCHTRVINTEVFTLKAITNEIIVYTFLCF